MLNMNIGDVIKLADASSLDVKQMVQLVGDLREAFQHWVTYVYFYIIQFNISEHVQNILTGVIKSQLSVST